MLPEHREEAVANCALSRRGEGPVPTDPLVKLTRPPAPSAPVRHGQVVKDEQVARSHGPSQAALPISIRVIPRPVRLAVGHQVVKKPLPFRPTPLAKKSVQRH